MCILEYTKPVILPPFKTGLKPCLWWYVACWNGIDVQGRADSGLGLPDYLVLLGFATSICLEGLSKHSHFVFIVDEIQYLRENFVLSKAWIFNILITSKYPAKWTQMIGKSMIQDPCMSISPISASYCWLYLPRRPYSSNSSP